MSFWAPGFWAPGFWAPGFWQESAGPAGVQRLLPPILENLSESAAVLALLGDPPRIWRHKRAPRSKVAPYVTWFAFGTPENHLSDAPPIDRVTVQLDCYATTDQGVEDLARQVRNALERFAHCTGMPIDERDPTNDLYRIALQFDYWLTREAIFTS